MIRRLSLLLLLGVLASPLTAQLVPKDGDDVAADGAQPAAPCPVVSGPFRFCGNSPQFTLTPQGDNADVTAYYVTPEAIQAVAVIEPLGSQDGLTIASMQQSALQILSQSTGTSPGTIPILERGTLDVSATSRPNFVYSGVVDGTPIVYSNTIVLLDQSVAQFVTLDIGARAYTDRHRELHARFLSNIQVAE
ncbi:hypothetical protein [Hasllibacter sp. MH4015]|uniref:hypothetical protein n=1 Tax=Hasllibacter sp. MH4015 TaxID=2854029 RepID=UPI001CD531AE|nr:hypothetical protein [Hasllibacter sp. MH4015]